MPIFANSLSIFGILGGFCAIFGERVLVMFWGDFCIHFFIFSRRFGNVARLSLNFVNTYNSSAKNVSFITKQ